MEEAIMSALEKRLAKLEEELHTGKKRLVVNCVHFGGGPLPPRSVAGVVEIRYVHYADIQRGAKADEARSNDQNDPRAWEKSQN
jgi:hypothetical protein